MPTRRWPPADSAASITGSDVRPTPVAAKVAPSRQERQAGGQRLRRAGHAAGHAHDEVDVHVAAVRRPVPVEQPARGWRADRGRRPRTRARSPRCCIWVCSSTIRSHGLLKTSRPKLTVPSVSEAASGSASRTASRCVERVGDRAAAGELDDQVGALPHGGDDLAHPRRGRASAGCRRRGRAGGSPTAPTALAVPRRRHDLLDGHRQRRDVGLRRLRPGRGDGDEGGGGHRPIVADRTARTRSRAAATACRRSSAGGVVRVDRRRRPGRR